MGNSHHAHGAHHGHHSTSQPLSADRLDALTLQRLQQTFNDIVWSSTHPILCERTFIERVEPPAPIPGLAPRLFRSLDLSGNGELDFKEFAAGLNLLRSSSKSDRVALIMTMYGAEGRRSTHVDRRGLRDLQLDLVAANAPRAPHLFNGSDPATEAAAPQKAAAAAAAAPYAAPTSKALRGLVDAAASAAMVRFDADGDDRLSAPELAAFVASEDGAVGALLWALYEMGTRLYGGKA